VVSLIEEGDAMKPRRLYTCNVCGQEADMPPPITVQIHRPDGRTLVLLVCSAPCLVNDLTARRLASLVAYHDGAVTA
jgi:hypothetical protein